MNFLGTLLVYGTPNIEKIVCSRLSFPKFTGLHSFLSLDLTSDLLDKTKVASFLKLVCN